MGWGYSFICKKCGKHYEALTGSGEDSGWKLLKDIKAGKYGEDLRIAVDTPGMSVSHELFLYVCDKCYYWEPGPDFTIYVQDEDKPPLTGAEQFNYLCKGLSVWPGDRPFKVYKRKDCLCKKCRSRMRMIEEEPVSITLSCPNCSELNENYANILWD